MRPLTRCMMILAALAGSLALLSAAPAQDVVQATLIRVIDGDTIQVRIGDRTEVVRYIGINTPEIHHPTRGKEPYGEAARDANRSLVEGQVVTLQFDAQLRDRYLRLLAYVWVGDRLINAELVKAGYAVAATFPPNVRHAEYFRGLEREARAQNRGLWGDPEAGTGPPPIPGSVEFKAVAAEPTIGTALSGMGGTSTLSPSLNTPSSSNGPVNVRGYRQSDGTYVAPYTRSAPSRRR